MPRYIIKKDFPIRAQAGDDFDISINVPLLFPLENSDIITFLVFEQMTGKVIISKSDEIIRTNQNLFIPFQDAETANIIGSFRWKLSVNRNGLKTRIGEGTFTLK